MEAFYKFASENPWLVGIVSFIAMAFIYGTIELILTHVRKK